MDGEARIGRKLKDLGLIFSQREGKEIWYDPAPGRVCYEQHDDVRFALTVTGRGSGVAVTVAFEGRMIERYDLWPITSMRADQPGRFAIEKKLAHLHSLGDALHTRIDCSCAYRKCQ